ncbi:hypothetical protein ITI46_16985 [Streptomyces oryzae]|uniref:Transcriptional regulator n=1 Tax=Streptomyces oryzae TaxID=1434886 RepID=A0ABS3XD94_9ACTN|nr:hypothetical protein [Streptomyces oryzae]MBO8193346.1 hypothetical protein [Streptomyces oryzae]
MQLTEGDEPAAGPRELAADPEAWPNCQLTEPGATAVQDVARGLVGAMAEQGLSLRRVADVSGVNRQPSPT